MYRICTSICLAARYANTWAKIIEIVEKRSFFVAFPRQSCSDIGKQEVFSSLISVKINVHCAMQTLYAPICLKFEYPHSTTTKKPTTEKKTRHTKIETIEIRLKRRDQARKMLCIVDRHSNKCRHNKNNVTVDIRDIIFEVVLSQHIWFDSFVELSGDASEIKNKSCMSMCRMHCLL